MGRVQFNCMGEVPRGFWGFSHGFSVLRVSDVSGGLGASGSVGLQE